MDDPVISRVVEHLSQHFQPTLGNLSHYAILTQEELIFSEVWQLRLSFEMASQVVFVKRYMRGGPSDSRRSVEIEYQILKVLHDRFLLSKERLSVVKPILQLPKEDIVVTEKFPGRKLQQVILSQLRWRPGTGQVEYLESLVLLSGQWLKRFQEFTRKDEYISVDRSSYLEEIAIHLDRCLRHGVSRRLVQRIHQFIDARFVGPTAYQLPLVGFHNDFSTWNILVGEQGLAVLDFDRFSYRHQYDDFSVYLVLLEAEKGVLGIRPTHVERLKQAFVRGYGTEEMDELLVALYMLKSAVKELGRVAASSTSHKKPIPRTYERLRIMLRKRVLLGCINGILKGRASC